MPNSIDYVLSHTGAETLSFVGHSQGTTQMFCALALNEEYLKSRVNLFVALGPVIRMSNAQSDFFDAVVKYQNIITITMKQFKFYELFGQEWNSV